MVGRVYPRAASRLSPPLAVARWEATNLPPTEIHAHPLVTAEGQPITPEISPQKNCFDSRASFQRIGESVLTPTSTLPFQLNQANNKS